MIVKNNYSAIFGNEIVKYFEPFARDNLERAQQFNGGGSSMPSASMGSGAGGMSIGTGLTVTPGSTYTVTWPSITWCSPNGNVAPTLSAGNTLVFWNVGGTLYGASVGKYA